MHEEIKLGASYIVRLLNRHQRLDSEQEKTFTETLTSILRDRFEGHWYPDKPQKGQAYRCVRIEQSLLVDDSVLQACVRSGLRCSQLALPRDMYLWIDPEEVTCRLGESCSPFVVKAPEATFTKKSLDSDKSDLETSDYHSDTSGTPSESSSEDEESAASKESAVTPVTANQKMGTQFYYSPTPSTAVYYHYPRNAVSFIPAYQPMTLYYLIPKQPKFYHKSRGTHQKWRSTRTAPNKSADPSTSANATSKNANP
ncbi:protein BTG3-like [Spea bombifrons]|uniref:protein BTG3-like n=1 Tax=Spea bombifrons TaxID=233779 RepID=UPI00234B7B3C|nr:protein BTG3-like [Spea bombifrons]